MGDQSGHTTINKQSSTMDVDEAVGKTKGEYNNQIEVEYVRGERAVNDTTRWGGGRRKASRRQATQQEGGGGM